MTAPRVLMILTENEPLIDLDDLDAMVELARIADTEGFDAVMLSEHLALGPAAGALGRPTNPREYAAPGNQDPAMGWPSQIVMASAIAAATENVRIVLGAIIAPLRHPVAMAKELATLDRLSHGRLVVQPTVSWHREEYDALGVDDTPRISVMLPASISVAQPRTHAPGAARTLFEQHSFDVHAVRRNGRCKGAKR